MMHGHDHSSFEVGEQSGASRCGAIRSGCSPGGAGGAKGGDQGECGPAKHAPDSEPGKRVTGAGRIRQAFAVLSYEETSTRPVGRCLTSVYLQYWRASSGTHLRHGVPFARSR